ncbi:MAG: hypothetical protein Q9187_001344 [Circinaria calcarea]
MFMFLTASCRLLTFQRRNAASLTTLERIAHKIQVGVELNPGTVSNAAGEVQRNLLPKPYNGVSIGLQGDLNSSGTLGGFVVLQPLSGQTLSEDQSKLCFLTCHHVIRSTNREVATRTDKEGISIFSSSDEDPAKVFVEYPSLQDLNAAHEEWSDRLKEAQDREAKSQLRVEMGEEEPRVIRSLRQAQEDVKQCQTVLSICDTRKANPVIGQVLASSGIRNTSARMRLDWALVQTTQEFFSRNLPPSKDSVSPERNPGNNQYHLTELDFADRFGDIVPDDWVIKRGRTTEVTCGKFNGAPIKVQWTNDGDETWEWAVVSTLKRRGGSEEPDVFAGQGDSGAMVFNREGELVGMVFGYHQGGKIFGSGLVTPIREIIADVKASTSGDLLLPQ